MLVLPMRCVDRQAALRALGASSREMAMSGRDDATGRERSMTEMRTKFLFRLALDVGAPHVVGPIDARGRSEVGE
jgi:hypothetical protein